MIKQAIEKIEELVNAREENKLEQVEIKKMNYYKFGGNLKRIVTPSIDLVRVHSLNGLVEMIESYISVEADYLNVKLPLIVEAENYIEATFKAQKKYPSDKYTHMLIDTDVEKWPADISMF